MSSHFGTGDHCKSTMADMTPARRLYYELQTSRLSQRPLLLADESSKVFLLLAILQVVRMITTSKAVLRKSGAEDFWRTAKGFKVVTWIRVAKKIDSALLWGGRPNTWQRFDLLDENEVF